MLTADGRSFSDPSGRVYVFEGSGERRVVRGLSNGLQEHVFGQGTDAHQKLPETAARGRLDLLGLAEIFGADRPRSTSILGYGAARRLMRATMKGCPAGRSPLSRRNRFWTISFPDPYVKEELRYE